MSRDPADVHFYDQIEATARDIARVVTNYRQYLVDGGTSEAQAWASAQRLERRLWDSEVMPIMWMTDDQT